METNHIQTHSNNNTNTNIHGIKYPALPSNVPTSRPKAPGATYIPGAVAFLGVRFKLIVPAPTWNIALPTPANITAINGEKKTVIAESAVTITPAIAVFLGICHLSETRPINGCNPKANTLYNITKPINISEVIG